MKSRVFAALLFVLSTGLFCLPLATQTPNFLIFTIAGTGNYGYADGAATSAAIDAVNAIACDARNNIYLADTWNNRIRRISADGMMTTIAGTGDSGFSGDSGPAVGAKLNCPRGIAVDAQGNIYISDSGNARVRKINLSGTISTIAGTGEAGFSGDGGPAASARLNFPRGLALDNAGNLYIADSLNFRIRKVIPQGSISSIAGMGAYGKSGDSGPATSASIGLVQSVAVDEAGNLFFTDIYNHCVRKIMPNGIISTVAGAGFGSGGDGGPATAATFRFPHGLALDLQGRIFIADSGSHRIRMIDQDGIITTLAGTGSAGFSGDGTAATSAQIDYPYAVSVDPSGALLVADLRNYRMRRIGTAAQAPVYRRYFPYFLNQVSRLTSLAVVNLSSKQAALTFRARDVNGAWVGETSANLNSHAQMALYLHELIPSLNASSGWLEMESDTPDVEGFFLLWDTFAATDGAAVTGTTLKDFVFPVVDEAEFSLANPGSESSSCTLEYISSNGAVVNSTNKILQGKAGATVTTAQIKPPGSAEGYLHATCTADVAAVETFHPSGSLGVLSALEPKGITGSATTMYAPQYAVGGGYASKLYIINLEQAQISLTLTLIGDNGQVQGQPYSFNLPARGSKTLEGVQSFGLPQQAALVQGYVKVESSNGRFAGAVHFTDQAASRFGAALSLVSAGVHTAYFSQVAETDLWWTGMAGINTNASQATVTVEIYDVEGRMVGSGSRAIPPGGRVSRLLSEFAALPAMTKGYFKVSSTLPLQCFALFGTKLGEVLVAIPPVAQKIKPLP
jgi:sugar lactone lactonase YvrE